MISRKFPRISGQRRTLVQQYYHTIDWADWLDVQKFIQLYENVLNALELKMEDEQYGPWVETEFKALKKWIEKDGFCYQESQLRPTSGHLFDLIDLTGLIENFDVPELERQIQRVRDAVEEDPGLAIGTAKELFETTCKTTLSENKVHYDEDWKLTKLVKETRKQLGLIPESIPSSAKGSESIKRLLSNLGTVVQGIAELRNLYGTGHGRHGKAKGLSSRHARLVVDSAATLTMFLLETHQEKSL